MQHNTALAATQTLAFTQRIIGMIASAIHMGDSANKLATYTKSFERLVLQYSKQTDGGDLILATTAPKGTVPQWGQRGTFYVSFGEYVACATYDGMASRMAHFVLRPVEGARFPSNCTFIETTYGGVGLVNKTVKQAAEMILEKAAKEFEST